MTDTTGPGDAAAVHPDRIRTLLGDINRQAFREFNPTQAGLMGCGVSAALLLAAPLLLLLVLGWSWWALLGLAVGGALVWGNVRMSDGRSYRKMARTIAERAAQGGIPFDAAVFRAAALEKPSAVALSYREVGFLYRLLRALDATDAEATAAVETAEQARPRATLSEEEYEEALAESRRR